MENIGDNGELYSTYNPNSKWDWYQVGGRWSGMLKTKNENYVNITKKKNILNLREIIPFALIINGKWYEKGKMGWWGFVSDKKEENEWEDEFRQLIDKLPNETELSAIVNLIYLSARDIYRVEREDKADKGFVDYIFYPENKKDPGIILELKVDHSPREALKQIVDKDYKLKYFEF